MGEKLQGLQIEGLVADIEEGAGQFIAPIEFQAQYALLRMDILTDWIADMNMMLSDAQVEYFMELTTQHAKPETSFEDCFKVYEKVLKTLDADTTEDLKNKCKNAFENWKRSFLE